MRRLNEVGRLTLGAMGGIALALFLAWVLSGG